MEIGQIFSSKKLTLNFKNFQCLTLMTQKLLQDIKKFFLKYDNFMNFTFQLRNSTTVFTLINTLSGGKVYKNLISCSLKFSKSVCLAFLFQQSSLNDMPRPVRLSEFLPNSFFFKVIFLRIFTSFFENKVTNMTTIHLHFKEF